MGIGMGITPGTAILQDMPRVGGGSRVRHTSINGDKDTKPNTRTAQRISWRLDR
jgi:hypothetical protein